MHHQPSPEAQAADAPLATASHAAADVAGTAVDPTEPLDFGLAARTGYGTLGSPISLIANNFLLNYKDISIYHYDVEIIFKRQRLKDQKPPSAATAGYHRHQVTAALGKERCRQVMTELIRSKALEQFNPVYDSQKTIYTTKPFPIQKKTSFAVNLEEKDRVAKFEVVIQPVLKPGGGNIISLEPLFQLYDGQSKEVPQEVLMVFDTVMCHRNPPLTQVQVGRSFYMLNQTPFRLGDGMQIWFGYNQSVRLVERGPAVLVNFSAKAFHQSGSVIHYASDLLGQDVLKMGNWDRRSIRNLGKSLRKVKIQVTHLPFRRKYSVQTVTYKPARDLPVTINGTTTTVATYFEQKYRPLDYPYLPCLSVQSSHATYIPMEVCEVCPNQPVFGKLSPATRSKMIRQTAISPEERFRRIQGEAQKINDVSGEIMKGFDLSMDTELMPIIGRILPVPGLRYKNRRNPLAVPDQTGRWRVNDKKLLKSPDWCTWCLLSFAAESVCTMNNLRRVAATLHRTAGAIGMNMSEVTDIRIFDRNASTYSALKYTKDKGVTFAFVILSSRDPFHYYEEVKFVGDFQLRLITQCMDERTATREFCRRTAQNVLLKINSKIGGVNHALIYKHVIFNRPVIIMAAHLVQFPYSRFIPSTVAVVGSLDASPSRYAVVCRTQPYFHDLKNFRDVIQDIKGMVRQVLEMFLRSTLGTYPEKIVFLRGGVGEGQYANVLEHEVPGIKSACEKMLNGNKLPLTYLVVRKSRKTVFCPKNPKDGTGRMNNVPPGTVVDTDVVHPVNFDFFLCSHGSEQGTSKPVHYTVIYDENTFPAGDLQKLCFDLCHTSARCNKSTSVPAPLMYAHLACRRARNYADWYLRSSLFESSFVSGWSDEPRLPEELEDAINNMSNFEPGMFFV